MKHRIIAAAVLAAVLCLALLAACGSGEPTRKDYEAIKEGTPRSEVLEKFGEPDSGLSGFFGIFTTAGIRWSSFTMKSTTAAMPQR